MLLWAVEGTFLSPNVSVWLCKVMRWWFGAWSTQCITGMGRVVGGRKEELCGGVGGCVVRQPLGLFFNTHPERDSGKSNEITGDTPYISLVDISTLIPHVLRHQGRKARHRTKKCEINHQKMAPFSNLTFRRVIAKCSMRFRWRSDRK